MRTPLAFVIAALAAACSFPDVDYTDSDGGGGASSSSSSSSASSSSSSSSSSSTSSSSSSGMTCPVPPSCAMSAMNCSDIADNKHKSCVQPCKVDQVCIGLCDSTWKKELAMCAAACDSCGSATCMGAPTNCNALVGL